MKKIIVVFTILLTMTVIGQDAARVLQGSAQPPLPFNIIPQSGFENRTTGWSVTGGVFTATNVTAEVARGKFSGKWTPPASTVAGVLLQSEAITIPPGLFNHTCRAQIYFRGNGATNGTFNIEAFDGTNILGTANIPDKTYYDSVQSANFTCPTSGTLRIRIRNTATTAASPTAMYFDEAIITDVGWLGVGSSVTAINAFGSSPNSAGGSISGGAITLQPASATQPGGVTTGAQTLAGAKTFSTVPILSSLSTGILHSDSGGNLTSSTIVNADINASAAIVDTKLATIATSGKVSNSATTAASANTASAIVARDGSGNFSAGTITAALTGNASTASALASNPTDCGSGEFANAIAANGDLTCAVPSSGTASPLTTKGDLYSYSTTNGRLPVGANNTCLVADSSVTFGIKWGSCAAASGTGDVVGPVSSTANAIARFDGTTGKLLKDLSSITITDNGDITSAPSSTTSNGITVTKNISTANAGGVGAIKGIGSTGDVFATGTQSVAGIIGIGKNTVNSRTINGGFFRIDNTSTTGTSGYAIYVPQPVNSGDFSKYYGLYIAGASTGTVSGDNRAIHVNGGLSYFGGKIVTGGSAPTPSSCGTSPTVEGNDVSGVITVGTGGTAQDCTITFTSAFTNAPHCMVENETDIAAHKVATTTTTMIVSQSSAYTASAKLHYICIGHL